MEDSEAGGLRALLKERERLVVAFVELERRMGQLHQDVVETVAHQNHAIAHATSFKLSGNQIETQPYFRLRSG